MTDTIQRSHPELDRAAARQLLVGYLFALAAALLTLGLLVNPLVVILLTASGLNAVKIAQAGGQLYDKLCPPKDQSSARNDYDDEDNDDRGGEDD